MQRLDATRYAKGCFDQFGLFDHHNSVGAARYDTAGGNRGTGARINGEHRRVTGCDHFLVQGKDFRISVTCSDGVSRAHGKAVDISAVKRGRIDRGDDIVGEHARARFGQGNCLRG